MEWMLRMRLWALCLGSLLALAGCGPGAAPPPAITEVEVRDYLARFEDATRRMDADALAPLVADWARFRIEVSGVTGDDVLHVGREEYLQSARDLARFRARLTYRPGPPRIEIAPDGASVRVWQDSRETLRVGELVLKSSSSGMSELRRGPVGLQLVHAEGRTVLSL
ncbi:hypothetical protein [Coralloluteibacterium thermophilus]|uniref:Nuclear transport factor 2 family protein n=1 Tax=Coralloluteibacterium thermophilum TaxID=2707049 RepID=A0ABV9NIM2_9GAMM